MDVLLDQKGRLARVIGFKEVRNDVSGELKMAVGSFE